MYYNILGFNRNPILVAAMHSELTHSTPWDIKWDMLYLSVLDMSVGLSVMYIGIFTDFRLVIDNCYAMGEDNFYIV